MNWFSRNRHCSRRWISSCFVSSVPKKMEIVPIVPFWHFSTSNDDAAISWSRKYSCSSLYVGSFLQAAFCWSNKNYYQVQNYYWSHYMQTWYMQPYFFIPSCIKRGKPVYTNTKQKLVLKDANYVIWDVKWQLNLKERYKPDFFGFSKIRQHSLALRLRLRNIK